jgi:hypothetical protein
MNANIRLVTRLFDSQLPNSSQRNKFPQVQKEEQDDL